MAVELLGRLAALTPRPRINLVLYYGVLGARAAWRSRIGVSHTVERLGLATAVPTARPARPPPIPFEAFDRYVDYRPRLGDR